MGVTVLPSAMKVLVLIACLGFASANILKREAKSDPAAFLGGFGHGIGAIGYVRAAHHVPVATTHHASPKCKHTPMRECTPRKVEHPRKVCQQVKDVHEDTIVTEDCEETITKVCTITSVTEEHTSTVVDESSKLIESGEPKDPESLPKSYSRAIYKREADPEASRYVSTYHRPAVGSAPITKVSTPDCTTTPVKSCERNPKTKQRNVFRTVCDTVVDVEEIQDCTETVTSNCETVRHSTKKVGYETINKSGGSSAPLQVGGGSVDYSDYSNYGGGVEEA